MSAACRQAVIGAAVVVGLVAAVVGGGMSNWAFVGGAAIGGVVYAAIACWRASRRA